MQGLILILQMLAVVGMVVAGIGIMNHAKLKRHEMVLMIVIGGIVTVGCIGASYLCVRML